MAVSLWSCQISFPLLKTLVLLFYWFPCSWYKYGGTLVACTRLFSVHLCMCLSPSVSLLWYVDILAYWHILEWIYRMKKRIKVHFLLICATWGRRWFDSIECRDINLFFDEVLQSVFVYCGHKSQIMADMTRLIDYLIYSKQISTPSRASSPALPWVTYIMIIL